MPALIEQSNLAIPKFEKGDAGIILKSDGSFVVWNTFEDPANPTARQIEQGEALLAFSAALKVPQLMDVLLNVAKDPAVFDQTVNVGASH